MTGVTKFHLEVVLISNVNAMNPWYIYAIWLSILTLSVLQIAVIMDKVHETCLVVIRDKAEQVVIHISICRYI